MFLAAGVPAPAQDPSAVNRFGFVGCHDGNTGCLSGVTTDVLTRLEMCARERPCRFADDCGPAFARDDAAKLASKVEALRLRAEARCQALGHLVSGLDGKARQEVPEPQPAVRPSAGPHVLTPGTYYADLEWLQGTDGKQSDCAGGRISLNVSRDFVVAWTLKGPQGPASWKAVVDPDTGQMRAASPERIEIAAVGKPGIDVPGEIEGRFSQFMLVSACGRGKVTVTNLAKAAP